MTDEFDPQDDMPDADEFKQQNWSQSSDGGTSMEVGGLDVGKAFTYIIADPDWISKLGIGALLTLLSFLILPIPLLVGWSVGVARNVWHGEETPMPEWSDWGELFRDGISIIAAQLVYTLPFWILMCIATIAAFASGGLAEAASEDAAAILLSSTMLIVSCLSILFAIALFFISPAIIIQYIKQGELRDCFQFGEVIGLARKHIGDILIAAVALFVLNFIISMATGVLAIIPCLGQIAAILIAILLGPYLSAVSGHLYGQIARKDKSDDLYYAG